MLTRYACHLIAQHGDPKKQEIPVAWDKDRNHDKFGNILFTDHHVSGFVGKNWQENLRKR